jgi:hypothetical protein
VHLSGQETQQFPGVKDLTLYNYWHFLPTLLAPESRAGLPGLRWSNRAYPRNHAVFNHRPQPLSYPLPARTSPHYEPELPRATARSVLWYPAIPAGEIRVRA